MSCFRVFGFECFLCLTFKRKVRLKKYSCFSFISFFHQNVCRAAYRFLPFISFCLVLFGLLLLASQGFKLFGSCWFSFFSIHQVAVLFIVQLSLRDLCCLLALDCPFKVSETGLRVSKFNFNFSSFVGAVGWAVLAFFYLGLQTDFYFLMSSFGLFIVIGFAWLGIIWPMLTFSSFVLFISFQSCLWSSSAYKTCSVVGFSMPFQAQGRKFEGA